MATKSLEDRYRNRFLTIDEESVEYCEEGRSRNLACTEISMSSFCKIFRASSVSETWSKFSEAGAHRPKDFLSMSTRPSQ